MLNLTEHENAHAHNVEMQTNIDILTVISMINTTSENFKAKQVFTFSAF